RIEDRGRERTRVGRRPVHSFSILDPRSSILGEGGGSAVNLPSLSRALALLRRPRVWLPLALLVVAGLLAEPYLAASYSYWAGRRALDRNQARQARAWFEHCLRVWPDSARVHLFASRAARLTGDHDAAEHHLAECQRLEREPSEESNLEWALLQAEYG